MRRLIAALLIAAATGGTSEAADLKVMAALVLQDALDAIVADFSRAGGREVEVAYSTVGAIRQRIAAGERADVVVLTADAIDAMAREEKLGRSAPVALTRTGVAIRDGAVVPSIATIDQFRAALLAARSVAYTDPKTGGAFGTYFAGDLARLGLLDAVNAKAVLRRGSHEIVASVARGEAELGITFVSTIVSTPGAKVAGPLPPPLAGEERFAAGILKGSAAGPIADAFLDALRASTSRAVWTRWGFETDGGP
ncbi:MAG TPA: substrate-binding domain-containing protein [Xanthobacteraceae bacterium]|nr:substrate-binding domain-containing protein [Xanthobacteraceae bacterium]